MAEDLAVRHEKIMLPCVRVRAVKAGGSGTVLYSMGGGDEEFSTYVLTNHHVVSESIKIEEEWSTLLKKNVKMDKFEQVDVHMFDYRWQQREIGGTTYHADIMAYDKEEDLALLRLRTSAKAPSVAALYPRGEEKRLRIGERVICVGAGLGEPPVQTEGILSQFGREIDRREYWLTSAASIFGNSGGALFLARSYELIGVPARIAVAILGWSADAITHLSYSIPITRIYQFLEDQRFRFIYDASFTEKGEEEERDRLRKEAELAVKAKAS